MRRPFRPRLPVPLLAAVLIGMLVAPPATAAEGTDDELDETVEQLSDATADLARLQDQIDEVQRDIANADEALGVLRDQLDEVEVALAGARAEADEADRAVEAARQRFVRADETMRAAEAAWDDARAALEQRVAVTWMHGEQASADVLLRGLLAAESMHDVAVIERASRNMLDADQRLLTATVASAETAASARATAEQEQTAIEREAVAAHGARARAQELVDRQQQLIGQAREQQAARTAALQRIEQDAGARAALVDRLEARVLELRLASLDQWLRDIADLPFDGPAPGWASGLPSAGRPLAPAIDAAAAAVGVDGRLLAALVWTESGFRASAISPAGAIGFTQLMPGTAAGLGVDPYDPVQNLLGGARYLRLQLERFGRIDLALAAYNAGPTRVADAGNAVPQIVETQLYVLRVLDRWEQLA